jgi:hypothetical protein
MLQVTKENSKNISKIEERKLKARQDQSKRNYSAKLKTYFSTSKDTIEDKLQTYRKRRFMQHVG